MKLKVKTGDLLKADDVDIIVQQVNCQGVMGSGIAKQIRSLYPEVYRDYCSYCAIMPSDKLLGSTRVLKVSPPKEKLKFSCLFFAQYTYGRQDKLYTDYAAFAKCAERLARDTKGTSLKIGIPYKIGCGLARGRWGIILDIFEDAFAGREDDIVIYRREED